MSDMVWILPNLFMYNHQVTFSIMHDQSYTYSIHLSHVCTRCSVHHIGILPRHTLLQYGHKNTYLFLAYPHLPVMNQIYTFLYTRILVILKFLT